MGEPLALANFALLAKKGALQSAPRGVRPGAEEGAGGGGSLEAWPKQTSFAEKKKKSKPKHRAPERAPLLRAPSLLSGHAPQPRASLRLQAGANGVSSPRDSQPMGWRGPPRPRRRVRGRTCEVASPFGRRRDTDLHLANGRRRWGRARDPLRANEAGRRGKHMALRVLPDAGVGPEGCLLKAPRVHRLSV